MQIASNSDKILGIVGTEQSSHYSKLYGIQYSPNEQAGKLESYLEIKFAEKPRRVLMTPRNRMAIVANSILPPFRHLELLKLALETDPSVHGTYDSKTNLIFINTDLPHTNLHENMHALAHQINPSFFETGNEASSEVLQARVQRRPHPVDEAQRMWLVKIFGEGIAETGALDVLFDRKHTVTDSVIEPYNLAKIDEQDSDEFFRISSLNGIITRSIVEKIIRGFKERTQFYELINWDNHQIYLEMTYAGVYFCQGSVNELRRNGLTIGEAFTCLVQNPPTTLEQLKDPVRFARGL